MTFFFYLGFISRTLAIDKIAREGMGLFIFHSTSFMHSQSWRYLYTFIYLHWLPRIFNHSRCSYQTSTRWDLSITSNNPAGNYMFKVNHRNTRTRCEICSKLTIKTPERRHRHFFEVIEVFSRCFNISWQQQRSRVEGNLK